MIININEKYRIKGDEYQYMVQRRKKDKSSEDGYQWESFQYFTTIESACKWLTERRLRTSEASTYAEVLAEKDRLIAELTSALAPMFEVKTR